MKPETQILLATYNGAEFLEEQLRSIMNQTYTNWEILARDDGSTDETMGILKNFQQTHPGKINIIEDNDGSLGAHGNFIRLMEESTADIICFADQDDVWHKSKMEQSISYLKTMHDKHGPDTPALVHHDMAVIDRDGEELIPSFNEHHNVDKSDDSLNYILMQNTVHGFSATTNRALIDKALPVPETLEAHDAHIALVAATFGNIHYIPEQLADYRSHGNNVSGPENDYLVKSYKNLSFRTVFNDRSLQCVRDLVTSVRQKLGEKCDNAAAFLNRYGEEIPLKNAKFLKNWPDCRKLA